MALNRQINNHLHKPRDTTPSYTLIFRDIYMVDSKL